GVRRQGGNDGTETLAVDIAIYRDDGSFAAAIEGLSLKPLSPEALRPRGTVAAGDAARQTAPGVAARASTGHGGDAASLRLQLREAPRAKGRELLIAFVRQEAMKT